MTVPLPERDRLPGSAGYHPGMTALTERDLAPAATERTPLERSSPGDHVFKTLLTEVQSGMVVAQSNGLILGGIGVSGRADHEDQAIAEVGLEAIKAAANIE